MNSVSLPVDRLPSLWPERFAGKRVGALLHAASVNSVLRPTLSILEEMEVARQIHLSALFGPQHGLEATTQDNMVEWSGFRHPRLDIPVYSLYGEVREPTSDMLEDIDLLFIDLFDVGARYYTFIWSMFLCLKASETCSVPVLVADRPNPLNGVTVEGAPQEKDYLSFVGLHPIPIRHARTIGELAYLFQESLFPKADLTVLPLEGWDRSQYYDECGLPWILPSPNMPTLETAIVYPGMCLFEGTNVSEGRGTTRPFELFGAPWIDGYRSAAELNEHKLPGVLFREAAFEPGFQRYAGEVCRGCQIHVTDRQKFAPVKTALAILEYLKETCAEHFEWKSPPYEYEYDKLPIEILCGRPENEIFTSTL